MKKYRRKKTDFNVYIEGLRERGILPKKGSKPMPGSMLWALEEEKKRRKRNVW